MNAKNLTRTLLLLMVVAAYPAAARAGSWNVGVSVGFAPPPLPVYVQPPCPSPGYIWTPGYWAYADEDGYYWVPGTWVFAPRPGLLWTPGYWSDEDDYFVWHVGYWAPHVGFYGGINYGFGYFGVGFAGGYWRDRDFFYNRSVTNVNQVNITNVYNSNVYNNRTINNNFAGNRVSYNGGDGVHARPSRLELAALHEAHHGMTAPQLRQVDGARTVRALQASINHGQPPIAATTRPGVFSGHGVVAARRTGGTVPTANRVAGNYTAHPPIARSPSTGASIERTGRPFENTRRIASPDMTGRTVRSNPTYARNTAISQAPRARQPAPFVQSSPLSSRQPERRPNPAAMARPSAAPPPDRHWAESRAPRGNPPSGANAGTFRNPQPAHPNRPDPSHSGRRA